MQQGSGWLYVFGAVVGAAAGVVVVFLSEKMPNAIPRLAEDILQHLANIKRIE